MKRRIPILCKFKQLFISDCIKLTRLVLNYSAVWARRCSDVRQSSLMTEIRLVRTKTCIN